MYNIGQEFTHGVYGKYKIIKVYKINDIYDYDIKFLNTCNVEHVSENLIDTGYIKDNKYKLIDKTIIDKTTFGEPDKYGFNPNDNTSVKVLKTWQKMIRSCTIPTDNKYYLYGARNITVCNEWLCFENFYHDFTNMENYDKWKQPNSKYILFINRSTSLEYSPNTANIVHSHNSLFNTNKEYIGVYKDNKNNYSVSLNYHNNKVLKAYFSDPVSAAIYRDWYAVYYFGPDCGLNNIDMSYEAFRKAQQARRGRQCKQLYHLINESSDKK